MIPGRDPVVSVDQLPGHDHFGGAIEPLRTTDRAVSGRVRTTNTRTIADMIERSQNIQRQPAWYARTPPRRGPKLGAVVMLLPSAGKSLESMETAHPNDRAPTNAPRSAGVAISGTTPYATEKVPGSEKPYVYA